MPIIDPLLVGRDHELARLDAAWNAKHIGVVTVVGRGGEGKTALVNTWLAGLSERGQLDDKHVYGWTFYSQGATGAGGASADLFFDHALKTFGHEKPIKSPSERGDVLARLLAEQPTLLIIDGLEPMQHGPGPMQGRLLDKGLHTLLRHLTMRKHGGGLCVLTTREPVADIAEHVGHTVDSLELDALSPGAGVELLRKLGARGSEDELGAAAKDMDGHALAITLLGTYLPRR